VIAEVDEQLDTDDIYPSFKSHCQLLTLFMVRFGTSCLKPYVSSKQTYSRMLVGAPPDGPNKAVLQSKTANGRKVRDAVVRRLDDCVVAANVRFDGLRRSMTDIRSMSVMGRSR
jgi:hypothetical protein